MLSAKELQEILSDEGLPGKGGQKDYCPDGSWLHQRKLEMYYEDRRNVLKGERVRTIGSLTQGEWIPKEGRVKLTKPGKFFGIMGYTEAHIPYLLPEEAMYLLDQGSIQINFGGIPMSIQEAMAVVLTPYVSLEQYHVFAYFARIGYILRTYKGITAWSRYEKMLGLHKHSKSSKGKRKICDISEAHKNEIVLDEKKSKQSDVADHATADVSSRITENLCNEKESVVTDCHPVDTSKCQGTRSTENDRNTDVITPKNPFCLQTNIANCNTESKMKIDNSLCNRRTSEDKDTHILVNSGNETVKLTLVSKLNEDQCGNCNSYESCSNDVLGNKDSDISEFESNSIVGYEIENKNSANKNKKLTFNDNKFITEELGDFTGVMHEDHGIMETDIEKECAVDSDIENERNVYTYLPYSHWDFEELNFPDISNTKTDKIKISPKCSVLSALGLQVSVNDYEFDISKYKRSNHQTADDLEFSQGAFGVSAKRCAKNWAEYKEQMAAITDEEVLLTSPVGHLWQGDVQPLVKPQDATSTGNILAKLNVIKNSNFTELSDCAGSDESEDNEFKIAYDGYLPSSKFKKSSPGVPHFRLAVTRQDVPPPSLATLAKLTSESLSDGVPLYWAVVDCGDIAFYSLNGVDLPQQVTLG